MERWTSTYCSPVGTLLLTLDGDVLTGAAFSRQKTEKNGMSRYDRQLDEYFAGQRNVFDIPLRLDGTEFQRDVWNALLTIPYGETKSYKNIAVQIGRPSAVRAVGQAIHRNPVAVIVPCHRVIGSDGSLTGFAGGLDVKEQLLNLEKKYAHLFALSK